LWLKNGGAEEKTLTVKEHLPYGASGFGFVPEPVNDEEEIKWQVKLGAEAEAVIAYWLKLPDAINSYEVKSEIFEGEQGLDEASLTFEVSQVVTARLDELLTELETLNVSGKDRLLVKTAIRLLQQVRNSSADSIDQLFSDVRSAARASHSIGQVISLAGSTLRLKIQNVMMVYARRLYEKLTTLSTPQLQSFTNHLLSD
jgi:hypothetical protein